MLDSKFLNAVARLKAPDLGTEHAAWLLYTIVRMTRPTRILEVGMGYTTPFLLRALADNVDEFAEDLHRLEARGEGDPRLEVLLPEYHEKPYQPHMIGVDDYSEEDSTAAQVRELLDALGLEPFLTLYRRSFQGLTRELRQEALPLDFVWFDCGGPAEYIDFLREYWPVINPAGGILALHYTHWHWPTVRRRMDGTELGRDEIRPTMVLNEIKRQQAKQGIHVRFETASLVEPHKGRQGSVTLVRRLGSETPDGEMNEELRQLGFGSPPAGFELK